jgi:two-component system OmpR family sensor kinase
LITLELAATGAIVAVLALVTFWVLRLGVRPIKRMTETASSIAGGDLSHRVPEGVPGTEAGDLGLALNGMLGRIEDAFDERTRSEDRLRRFVADASHELRTPVTTIRGYAELYRSGALDDDDELREAMRRTEQEAMRMGSLVDDLLLLARLDQGRPLEREAVDLSELAQDAVRDAHAVDPDRPISASVPGPVIVVGDDGRLRQVVGNLVRNAIVHTPAGTPVKVRVKRVDGRARLEVRDEGPGMSSDVAAKAFERFYRADASRTRARGGSGLGLSIVDATVRAHDGVVSLDTAPGRGTTVRIEFSPADSA